MGSPVTSPVSRNSWRKRERSGDTGSRGARRDGEIPWSDFLRLEQRYGLPRPRVVHGLLRRRSEVLSEEPGGVMCKPGSVGGATRSYGCTCYDWSYDQDVTQCATTDTLPRRAAGVTWRYEALGTT